ncbi:uncharacterized protein [Penaeus vannamei]|uniref:uncharacterized protein n=1 Tax=Penaeus vannamei TaxID=6689 RepID=UPI00387F7845
MIDGSLVNVPEAIIHVGSPFFTGKITAAVMVNPIFDVIIGNIKGVRNSCGADAATQTGCVAITRSMEKRKGELTPLTSVSDLINSQDIVQEQKSDSSLESVRRKLAEKSLNRSFNEETRFIERNKRIYRRVLALNGEERLQFVVPARYRLAVFRLGHHSALGGHMGQKKTLDRIQAEFFWPGMGQEISRLVRSCDICQRTSDRGRVKPAPLKPMPLISEPFERVAVDIVGPIHPRASDGCKYILTLVDFSTRWPEAVPLRNIDAVTVAEAMVEIFCRIGIPRQVLSDRGTQFTSAMMEEVLRLLSIKGLKTTPYHPMCNGLCERFNGTLKKMLKRMAAEQPKEWPRYLAPLLFAYREVPQSSLKFSPFELVYGRTVRGPLQILRELWDDSGVDTESTCDLAKQELLKAQETQKAYYDRKAKVRLFKAGDKCLILLPTSHNKLLAQWKGPYDVVDKVSNHNYLIQVGNQQKRFHINMLKEYFTADTGGASYVERVVAKQDAKLCITREGASSWSLQQQQYLAYVKAFFSQKTSKLGSTSTTTYICAAAVIPESECDDGPVTAQSWQTETIDNVKVSDTLKPEERKQLRCLLNQFSYIFSDRPKVARVNYHHIELTSSKVVRQKPYPIPMRLVDAVKKEIEDMADAGIIEKSTSPFCSPIVVVQKKDGSVRICGDYRKINTITKTDAEPMCDQRAIFSRLTESKFFSKLDLTKGFFQIPLHPESREVTAFTSPAGLYQFRVLPFGLSNSPAVFNRVMRQVLQGVKGVEAFIDDILVHSSTFEEHLKILEEVFQRLQCANMTVKPSFFQIPLHPESREVTAFTSPAGLYQFRVLPFGLSNSPAVFNRVMRQVLQGVKGVEAFIDDILVHSSTFEEHLKILEEVFQRLQCANMTVNPSKCEIGFKEVQYLGHTLGEGRCSCQNDKIKNIKDAPRPTTKKQVRSFLGLTGYYRSFVPNFAVLALPLFDLLKKHAPNKIRWGDEQEDAFNSLKKMLCKQPILQLPNFQKPFILRTDASQDGVGAVLMQETDGEIYPVAYHSCKLKSAERNYSTVEKELLAVVDGIKKYYFYLYGDKFLLETDHMPLESLRTSKNANARLMRWAMYLQQFNFAIRYIKGSANVGADFLSRLVENWQDSEESLRSDQRGAQLCDGTKCVRCYKAETTGPLLPDIKGGRLSVEPCTRGPQGPHPEGRLQVSNLPEGGSRSSHASGDLKGLTLRGGCIMSTFNPTHPSGIMRLHLLGHDNP